jgi:16S rRNA (cytosine1402-N4)-methyltransferase
LAFAHIPVMLREVLETIQPRAGGRYLDGTVGGGGHAAGILAGSAPSGWLYGCDRDEAAVAAAQKKLAAYGERFEIRPMNYVDAGAWVAPGTCDGVLLDLGVSSAQLDTADRGFSFLQDGPLDMRMDRRCGPTAAELLAEVSLDALARLFWEYGEEPLSKRIAAAIVAFRDRGRLQTTGDLVALVERVVSRRGGRIHPATRVFQALRIAVNDELGTLERGLPTLWSLLAPRGRLVVISFHSLEARLVKHFGRNLERNYAWEGSIDIPEKRIPKAPQARRLYRHAVRPSEAEMAVNPRARSAQLRAYEKT